MEHKQAILAKRLRRLAAEFAALIAANPPAWAATLRWLQSHPVCCECRRVRVGAPDQGYPGDPFVVDIDERPPQPGIPHRPFETVYCNEQTEADFAWMWDTTHRQLLNAWAAVTYRFFKRDDHARYHDFGIDDALKIGLLMALTFNRDADRVELGFEVPWSGPKSDTTLMKGREHVADMICDPVSSKECILEIALESWGYIKKMAHLLDGTSGKPGQAAGTAGQQQPDKAESKGPADYPKPTYDRERRALWYRGKLVKRFKQKADSQEPILVAFEEAGWPPKIDDPISPRPGASASPQQRLSQAIIALSRGQALIKFTTDGTGEGILWEPYESTNER